MLNKQNFSIAKLAPDDPDMVVNPVVLGIYIAPERTCVTDGHCAVIVSAAETTEQPGLFDDAEGVEPADAFTPFVLDRESALKIAKAIPKKAVNVGAQFGVVDATTESTDRAMISINDAFRQEILRAKKIPGAFPDIDRAFPDPDTATATIHMGAELFSTLMNAVSEFCSARETLGMKLQFFGNERPLVISVDGDGQTLKAVVMPLQVKE